MSVLKKTTSPQENELEDGEISSDSDNEDEKRMLGVVSSVKIPPNQNSGTTEESGELPPPADDFSFDDYVLNERPKAAFSRDKSGTSQGTFERSKIAEYYSSSDDSRDDTDDNSSDDDEFSSAKRFRGPSDPKKSSSSSSRKITNNVKQEKMEDLSAFNAQAASYQQKRKSNNIWCEVLQEQEFEETFNKVKVADGNLREVDRGPETFFVESRKRPRPEPLEYDSSSVSSPGLSDDTLEYLNGNDSGQRIKMNSVRRKKRRKSKRNLQRKLVKLKAEELAQHIADKLEEPKSNLILRTITVLGKAEAVRLFIKTNKIEKRGGLLIRNQQRRRTPGGVFLFLLRRDPRFLQKDVDLVFKEEQKISSKAKKQRRAQRRLQRKARLEKLVSVASKNCTDEPMRDEDDDSASLEEYRSDSSSDSSAEQGASESKVFTPPVPIDDDEDCLNILCETEDLAP